MDSKPTTPNSAASIELGKSCVPLWKCYACIGRVEPRVHTVSARRLKRGTERCPRRQGLDLVGSTLPDDLDAACRHQAHAQRHRFMDQIRRLSTTDCGVEAVAQCCVLQHAHIVRFLSEFMELQLRSSRLTREKQQGLADGLVRPTPRKLTLSCFDMRRDRV